MQGDENRRDGGRTEVDQRLGRDLRGVRMIEMIDDHRQGDLVSRPSQELEDEGPHLPLRGRSEVIDEGRDLLPGEGLPESRLDEVALGDLDDSRLAGLGDPNQGPESGEVELLLLGDDAQEEIHRPHVGDLADRFEDRLAQRLLGIEGKNGR